MDADENTMRDDSLKRTHQQVDSCESVFLSPDDLQMFGIRAFQVGMTEDGDLQFNPCFFLPEEFRVLKEYPLDPLNMSDMSPLNPRPDYDAILEKCNKVWPEADEAIKNATEEYNELLGSFADDWITHARDTREHVKCQMSAKNRGGMPRSLPVKVSFLDFPPPWMQWR